MRARRGGKIELQIGVRLAGRWSMNATAAVGVAHDGQANLRRHRQGADGLARFWRADSSRKGRGYAAVSGWARRFLCRSISSWMCGWLMRISKP